MATIGIPFPCPRRRLFRLPRRRGGIDLQQLPWRTGHIRLVGPRVHRHPPVFKRGASPRTEPLRYDLEHTIERCPPLAPRQHDLGLRRTALHPGLDADTSQTKIGIERPHPQCHGRPGRHAGRRFLWLLDGDLRGQIGQHLDPVFEFFRLHLLPAGQRRATRLKHQPVRRMLGCRAFGIHLQHERAACPCQIARPHLEFQVAAAITPEVDPRRLQRLVALGDDHDTRALDGPQVALPRHRLPLSLHVCRKLIPHLPDQKGWRIDQRHADRLTPPVAGLHRERHRLIEPAGRIGQHGCIPLPGGRFTANPCHLHSPRYRRPIDGAAVEQGRDDDHRPLVASQTADRTAHAQLPATDQRGPAGIDLDASGIVRVAAISAAGCRVTASDGPDDSRLFSWHPPLQSGWFESHPRRRRHAGPWREQPRRGGEHALRGRQRVDTRQAHKHRQRIGQPHRLRTIDDRLGRHGREPFGRPPLERLHDRGGIALWMRLDQHGVDEIVVEFGMFLLDHPRRVDEIDAIPQQRQDPPDARRNDRRKPHQEPCPPRPAGQATCDDPVLQQNPAGDPEQRRHPGPQQKRGERDPLVVGAGRGEPPGEVAFRLGVGLAVVAPRADGKRLGGWV